MGNGSVDPYERFEKFTQRRNKKKDKFRKEKREKDKGFVRENKRTLDNEKDQEDRR